MIDPLTGLPIFGKRQTQNSFSGGGGGGIRSIQPGSHVTVNNADPSNPIVNSADPFITDGNNGISSIRFMSSGGLLFDLTINDAGSVVVTPVVVSSASVGANAALTLLGP